MVKTMDVTEGNTWSVRNSYRRASLGGRDRLNKLFRDGPHGVRLDFNTRSGQDHEERQECVQFSDKFFVKFNLLFFRHFVNMYYSTSTNN